MSTRYWNGRPRAKTHAPGFLALAIVLAIVAVAVAGVVGLVRVADEWLSDLPDASDAEAYSIAAPSQVYSADGVLLAEFATQNRTAITIDKVSPYVLNGTVDTEDVRFYEHNGVDIQGIGRAVISQLTGGNEGGSTITQQYVRNTLLLDEMNDLTIRRKVREAFLALEIERQYSKDDILMMYLNTINYGDGAYGIEAASQHYFSKSASDLTLAEAALLVGIPQSPNNLNPVNNPDAAVNRRNTVLDRMLTAGDITQQEHDAAQAEPLNLNVAAQAHTGIYRYPYFVTYVQGLLSENYSDAEIFRGGLVIQTSLDTRVQDAAEEVTNRYLEGQSDSLEYSLTSIDPKTGHILAMVGGRDYYAEQFNLATQARRQAGSSMKTFTLVTALKEGISPQMTCDSSSPATISPTWTVRNSEGTGYGDMTIERATWLSVNTVYAHLAHAIGAQPIVDTCKSMGITSPLESVESISLGTQGVCTLEMASAYATLAANGVHRDPSAITKITNSAGDVLFQEDTTGTQVLDPEVASVTTDVLEGVITRGTGSAASLDNGQAAAGKTGTSENCRDNWFCGYTPQLATAIWLGSREDSTIYYNGGQGYGGNTCAPVWGAFTEQALGIMGADNERFRQPTGSLTYDWSRWSSVFGGSGSSTSTSTQKDEERQGTATSTAQTTSESHTSTSTGAGTGTGSSTGSGAASGGTGGEGGDSGNAGSSGSNAGAGGGQESGPGQESGSGGDGGNGGESAGGAENSSGD